MLSGVRSRRLATVVAARFTGAPEDASLREWLAGLDVEQWRQDFEPASAELADLLIFSRVPDADLAAQALDGATVEVDIRLEGESLAEETMAATLELDNSEDPPAVLVNAGGTIVGRVAPQHHDVGKRADFARRGALGL